LILFDKDASRLEYVHPGAYEIHVEESFIRNGQPVFYGSGEPRKASTYWSPYRSESMAVNDDCTLSFSTRLNLREDFSSAQLASRPSGAYGLHDPHFEQHNQVSFFGSKLVTPDRPIYPPGFDESSFGRLRAQRKNELSFTLDLRQIDRVDKLDGPDIEALRLNASVESADTGARYSGSMLIFSNWAAQMRWALLWVAEDCRVGQQASTQRSGS
jgi:hypothetical protein